MLQRTHCTVVRDVANHKNNDVGTRFGLLHGKIQMVNSTKNVITFLDEQIRGKPPRTSKFLIATLSHTEATFEAPIPNDPTHRVSALPVLSIAPTSECNIVVPTQR